MSEVVQLTNDTFKEIVLRSDHPVVIDFWGPQCVPCKQLDPFLDALSVELSGVVKFTKVVAPENRKLCVDLRIMGLPSFLAFKDGKVGQGTAPAVGSATEAGPERHLLYRL